MIQTNVTSEEAEYIKAYLKEYQKYGEYIPDSVWKNLRRIREANGISLQRSMAIIKELHENEEYMDEAEEIPNTASNILIDGIRKNGLFQYANGYDLFVLDISDSEKQKFRKGFGIDIDEEILWARDTSFWNSRDQGTVITDKQLVCIPDNTHTETMIRLTWDDIKEVKYRDMELYFYDNNGDIISYIHLALFFKKTDETNELKRAAQKLAEAFTRMADATEHEESLAERFQSLLEASEFEEARQLMIEHLKAVEDEQEQAYTYFGIAKAYIEETAELQNKRIDPLLAQPDEQRDEQEIDLLVQKRTSVEKKAINAYDKVLELLHDSEDEEDIEFCHEVYLQKSYIAQNIQEARNFCIEAMQSSDAETRESAQARYNDLTNCLLEDSESDAAFLAKNSFETEDEKDFLLQMHESEKFTNKYDYKDRQLIFVVRNTKAIAGCYDEEGNINWVFALNQIPEDIHFPLGHPQANTLYIGHPLKATEYIPFENATEQLFMEKIREFCYVAQCLGATEIRFRKIKGTSFEEEDTRNMDIEGHIGRKFANAELTYGTSSHNNESHQRKDGIELIQTYAPTEKPFCPSDVLWIKIDSSCQAMIRSRLSGNMLNYTERISSSETTNLSSNQIQSIKGSFEGLLFRASGAVKNAVDRTFSRAEELEWEINITFKPLNEFNDNATETPVKSPIDSSAVNSEIQIDLTGTEQLYKEEILFCLEDNGTISDDDRRYLERKRKKFGITEDRAKEIEHLCVPTLSDNEKEYIEAFKELSDNGKVTERGRKLLERERESLGISKERAMELEAKNR